MSYCYSWEYHCGKLKSWHRTNTIKAARKVAIPRRRTGKGAGKGWGFVWEPIPEALAERSWIGKANRKRKRQGLPPLDLQNLNL
jgi:hypothetical protein